MKYNSATYGVTYTVGSNVPSGTSIAKTLHTSFSYRNIPFTVTFLPANSTFSFSNTTSLSLTILATGNMNIALSFANAGTNYTSTVAGGTAHNCTLKS